MMTGLRVQSGGRLVQEEDVRVAHQRARDREALALPSRELAHPALLLVLEPDLPQHVFDRHPPHVEAAKERHGLAHRELFGELCLLQLRPHALPELVLVARPGETEHLDAARVRGEQSLDHLDRGRLPRPVGSEQTEAFTPADLEI
jgi:hypothetical protein